MTRRTDSAVRALAVLLALNVGVVCAQGQTASAAAASASSAPSAQTAAPFDPTGNWVSLVTRDWRFRMVVPGRGEYRGVPLSLAGKQFADAWDVAKDEAADKQCEAYGAGVVMLVPTRLRIGWQDDETLQVQTDAGKQTRLLHFQPVAALAGAPASWQGYSQASWVLHKEKLPPLGPGGQGAAPPPPKGPAFGSLKILTNNFLPGLLRKNGLPYSGQASLLEYWELQRDPITQTQYLLVTAVLTDPVYLERPYNYTATFLKEPDDAKWNPTACTLRAMP